METERMDGEKITDSRNSYVGVVERNLLDQKDFVLVRGLMQWLPGADVIVCVCVHICTCMCMMRYGWGKENKRIKPEIL